MRTQNFSSTLLSMLLAGTFGAGCQAVKEKAQSAEETVETKVEDAKETLEAREHTVTNIEPSSGAATGRLRGQAEDMRIEPDMNLTDPVTDMTDVDTDEDGDADVVEGDVEGDSDVTVDSDDMDGTDDTAVVTAPVVTTDANGCNRTVLATSPGAVGNPCMTTVAFVDTLDLDAKGRKSAIDGVARAGADVKASRVSH